MRVLVPIVRPVVACCILIALSGCLDPAPTEDEPSLLTFEDAVGAVDAPRGMHLAQASARLDRQHGLPTGLAETWVLTFEDWSGDARAFVVSGDGIAEREAPRKFQNNDEFECAVGAAVDSPVIAERLVQTRIWQDGVVPPSAPLAIELDCLARTTYWTISSDLQPNTDGSESTRSFAFSDDGVFAGFIGDASAGASDSYSVGDGLAVQVAMNTTRAGEQATFGLQHATRAAILVEPRGLLGEGDPLGEGRATIVDPSGETHDLAWSAGTGPKMLVIEGLAAAATRGTWTVDIDATSTGTFGIEACSGVPEGPQDHMTCAALA